MLYACRVIRPATLLLLGALCLGGCVSPGSRHTDLQGHAPGTVDERRSAVVQVASAQLGAPYRFGGNRPGGFDCSGLVQFSHRQAGVAVPRTASEQWRRASPLSRGYLVPGDLVFFSLGGDKPQHVGIYAGDGEFIHAPSSGKPVGRATLDNPYWRQRWIGSRTFL